MPQLRGLVYEILAVQRTAPAASGPVGCFEAVCRDCGSLREFEVVLGRAHGWTQVGDGEGEGVMSSMTEI